MKVNVQTVLNYVLIKETPNPFLKKKTDSGLIIADGFFDSQETGDIERMTAAIGFGIIAVTGPDVKNVKVGQGCYYRRGSVTPIPMNEVLWHTNEANLMSFFDAEEVLAALETQAAEDLAIQEEIRLATQKERDAEKERLESKVASGWTPKETQTLIINPSDYRNK